MTVCCPRYLTSVPMEHIMGIAQERIYGDSPMIVLIYMMMDDCVVRSVDQYW